MASVPATRSAGTFELKRLRVGEWSWRIGLGLTLALVAVFFLWPLADIVLRSLDPDGRVSFTDPTISLENYRLLFDDPALHTVLRNTVVVAALGTLATLLLAFPTAYLMSRLRARAAIVLYALILLPQWINILVRLFADLQLLRHNGPVNWGAGKVGLGPWELLYNTGAVTFGTVSYLLPILVLVLYAGMSSIDPSLITAAKSAGASGWYAFRRIFVPLVWPTVVGGSMLVFVLALGFFVTPAMLGGPENLTVSTYIAQKVQNYRWGEASAIGVFLLIAAVAVSVVAIRLAGLSSALAFGSGGGKGAGREEKLRWGLGTALLWACAGLAIVVTMAPLALIVIASFDSSLVATWPPGGLTLRWYGEAFGDSDWFSATGKSLQVALVASLLATLLGFVTARALLIMRRGSSFAALVMALVYAPLVVPVILLAIGTYDTQGRFGMLGSALGLAAVHAVLALPFTVTIFLAALRGFDRRLEEAAWTLGASRLRTVRRVVLPAIVPSAVGALLIAWMVSWDEVVVALFQTEGSQATLPVLFYSFVKTGLQPTVNVVGTLLIVVVGLATAIYWAIGRLRRRRAVLGGVS